jgi:hypothetical protein
LFDGRNGTNNSNTANLRTDLTYRVGNFSEPSASPYYNVSEDEVNTGQYNLNILKDALALGPVSMDVSVTDGGNLTATFSLTVNPTA